MQNKLILYTEKGCKACENVKNFLNGYNLPADAITIKDITNDLVAIQRLKTGIVGMKDGVEETFTAMTFPSLEVVDASTLITVNLITPSTEIIEYLATLNFPHREVVEDVAKTE